MIGFSVIIPTLNRTTFLLNTLENLLHQEFEYSFEIIVVDQSKIEDKEVLALAEKYPNLNYKYITHFKGLPEARNYGASIANYNYLLYLDDDITCSSDLLSEHFKTLKNANVNMVAGGITEKYNSNIDCITGKFVKYSATPLRGFHKKGKKEVDHAGGGNFSIKKNTYKKIGGVDERLTKGAALYEETDFCLRLKKAGYKIYYNYNAHVYHLAAKTGGCRVSEIHKYIYSLSRNRTIIIERYLPKYYKLTAYIFLLKLILSYIKAYKDTSLYRSYKEGKREGKKVALLPILNTSN